MKPKKGEVFTSEASWGPGLFAKFVAVDGDFALQIDGPSKGILFDQIVDINMNGIKLLKKQQPFQIVKRYTTHGHDAYFVFNTKKLYIKVGCRFFTSFKQARAHWQRDAAEWKWDEVADRSKTNKSMLKLLDRMEQKVKEFRNGK